MSVSSPIEKRLPGGGALRRSPSETLGRIVATLTSHRCLIPLCTANALGCMVVAVAYLGSLNGVLDSRGQVVTGDFLNFYNGGRMILAGQGRLLYDVEAQRASLAGIAGADYPNLHWYNYPPTWAVALAPICALPYVWAFYAYNLLMAAAMGGTLWLLRPWLPELAKRWYAVVLAVIFFHPIIRNIIGGQNTVLTTFLMAGVYVSLRSHRQVLAGFYLGLLLYKPQYALLLGLVMLLGGRWVTVASAGAVGVGHYLIGALFCGAPWPATMLDFLGSFREMEARLNAATHVSLLSASSFSLPAPWAGVAAGLVMLVVVGALLRLTRRGPTTEPAFAVRWALAVTGTLLLSPHTQYYDVGVLVLPVMLGLDFLLQQGRSPSTALRLFLVAGFVLYPIYEWSTALHFQPLLLWPMLTFGWLAALAWRTEAGDVRQPAQPVQPAALGSAHSQPMT